MEGSGEGVVAIIQSLTDSGFSITLSDSRCEKPSIGLNDTTTQTMNFNRNTRTNNNNMNFSHNKSHFNHCNNKYMNKQSNNYLQQRMPSFYTDYQHQMNDKNNNNGIHNKYCPYRNNMDVGFCSVPNDLGKHMKEAFRTTNFLQPNSDHLMNVLHNPAPQQQHVQRKMMSSDVDYRKSKWNTPIVKGTQVYLSRSVCGTDPFVSSLRKYPRVASPEGKSSSDIVHRLTCQTQQKYLPKCNSKSMRSFTKQTRDYGASKWKSKNLLIRVRTPSSGESRSTTKDDYVRQNRSMVFHTRSSTPRVSEWKEKKRTDRNCDHLADRSHSHKEGRRRKDQKIQNEELSTPPTPTPTPTQKTNRNGLEKSCRFRELRHASAPRLSYHRTQEVRFVTTPHDVRYLTGVTKYVREAIRQIYDDPDNLEMCPRIASRYSQHLKQCSKYNRKECADTQTTQSNQYGIRSCKESQVGPRHVCRSKHVCSSSDIHRRPSPITDRYSSHIPTSPPPIVTRDQITSAFCPADCPCPNADIFTEIKRIVQEWIQQVPVKANFISTDEDSLKSKTENLQDNLQMIVYEQNFAERAKDYTSEFLNSIPIWLPEDGTKDFKNNLANKLVIKLSNAQKKIRFRDTVIKFVNDLPLVDRDLKLAKERLVKELVDRVKPIAQNPSDNIEEYKRDLRHEIVDILQNTSLTVSGTHKNKFVNLAADELASKLANLPYPCKSSELDAYEKEVKEILKTVPQFADLEPFERKMVVRDLAKILQDLRSQNLEEGDCEVEIVKAINDWLNTVVDRNELERLIVRDIKEILDTIPLLSNSSDKKDNQRRICYLAKTLATMKDKALDDEEVMNNISNFFKGLILDLENSERVRLDTKQRNNVVTDLSNKAVNTLKEFKKIGLQKLFLKEIVNWYNDINDLPHVSDQGNKSIKRLIDKLMKISSEGVDDKVSKTMFENIRDFLEKALECIDADMEEKIENRLSENLTEKLIDILNNYGKVKINPLTQDVVNLVSIWLDNIPAIKGGSDRYKNPIERSANKLVSLIARGLDDEVILNQIHEEIKKLLNNILDMERVIMNPNEKKKLVNQLYDKLMKLANGEEIPGDLPKNFKEYVLKEVDEWCDNISEISNPVQEDVDKVVCILEELQRQGIIKDSVREEMSDEIRDFLNNTLTAEDTGMEVKKKYSLIGDLMKNLVKLDFDLRKIHPDMPIKSLADNYFRKIICWIDSIPELDTVTSNDEQIDEIKKLVTKLNTLRIQGVQNKSVRQNMANEIRSFLDKALESENSDISNKRKQQLVDVLLNKLIDLDNAGTVQSDNNSGTIGGKFLKAILRWSNEIDVLPSVTEDENIESLNALVKSLNELESEGIDKPKNKDMIMDEIKDFLDESLKKENARIDSKSKQTLADDLYKTVKDIARASTGSSTDSVAKKEAYVEEISNWIEDLSGIDFPNTKENKAKVKELADKIMNIQAEYGDSPGARELMMEEVEAFMDKVLDDDDAFMNSDMKELMADILLDNLAKVESEPKTKGSPVNVEEVEQKVEDLLESIVPGVLDDPEVAEELKDFAKKYADLINKGMDEKSTKQLIKKFVDNIVDKTDVDIGLKTKNLLASQLLDELGDIKPAAPTQTKIEKETNNVRDIVNEKLTEWAKVFPDITENVSPKDLQILGKKLAENLTLLDGEEAKERMHDEIKTFLDTNLGWEDDKTKNKLANILIKDLTTELDTKNIQSHANPATRVKSVSEEGTNFESQASTISTKKGKASAFKSQVPITTSAESENEPEAKRQMLEDVKEYLYDLLDNGVANATPKVKEKKKKENLNTDLTSDIFEKVADWTGNLGNIIGNSDPKETSKQMEKLIKQLRGIYTGSGDEDEKNDQAVDAITHFVENAIEREGANLSLQEKEKLTKKLMDKIRPTKEHSKYLQDDRNNGHTTQKEQEKKKIRKLETELANEISDEVANWVGNLGNVIGNSDLKETGKQMVKLVKQLEDIYTGNGDDDEKNDQAMDVIKCFMENAVEREGASLSSREKEKLAKKLMDQIRPTIEQSKYLQDDNIRNADERQKRMAKKKIDNLKTEVGSEISAKVADWVDDLGNLIGNTDPKETNKQMSKLMKQLGDIYTECGEDDEKNDQAMDAIRSFIDNTVEQEGASLSLRQKEKLAKKLMDQMRPTIEQSKYLQDDINNGNSTQNGQAKKKIDDILKTQVAISEKVEDWVDDLGNLIGNTDPKETNKQMGKLMKQLGDIYTGYGDDDEKNDQAMDAIRSFIDNTVEREGASLSLRQKEKLAKKLMDQMRPTIEQSKYLQDDIKNADERQKRIAKKNIDNLKSDVASEISAKVADWVDDLGNLIGNTDPKETNKQMGKLMKQLGDIYTGYGEDDEKNDQAMDAIRSFIDNTVEREGASLSLRQKEKLARKLMEQMRPTIEQSKYLQDDINNGNTTQNGQAKNKIDDILKTQVASEISEKVADWVDDLGNLIGNTDPKETNKQMGKLMKKLGDIYTGYGEDDEKNDQAMDAIKSFIENAVQREGASISPRENDKLAKKLIDQMRPTIEQSKCLHDDIKNGSERQKRIAKTKVDNLKTQVASDISATVADWVDDLENLIGTTDPKETNKQMGKLTKQLEHIYTGNGDGDEKNDRAMEAIRRFIDSTVEREGASLSLREKDKLSRKLMDQLRPTVERFDREVRKDIAISGKQRVLGDEEVMNAVTQWTDKFNEAIGIADPGKYKEPFHRLVEDMKQIQAIGLGKEEVRKDITEAIKKYIDTVSNNENTHMSSKDKQALAEKLLQDLEELSKREPNDKISKPPKGERLLEVDASKKISDWVTTTNNVFGDSGTKISKKEGKELMEKLKEIEAEGLSEAESRKKMMTVIADVLDDKKITQKEKNKLMQKLMKDITGKDTENISPRVSYSEASGRKDDRQDDPTSKKLSDRVGTVNNFSGDSAGKISEEEGKELMRKLKEIEAEGLNESETRKKMMKVIADVLDDKDITPKDKNKLIQKLMKDIAGKDSESTTSSVSFSEEGGRKNDEQEGERDHRVSTSKRENAETNVEKYVKDWAESALKSGVRKHNDPKKISVLIQKLKTVSSKPMDTDVKKKMEREIKAYLDVATDKDGRPLDDKEKSKWTAQLVNKFIDDVKSTSGPGLDITSWMKEVPELSQLADKKEHQKAMQKLKKEIIGITSNINLPLENVKKDVKEKINEFLDELIDKEGVQIDPVHRKEISDKLIKKMDTDARSPEQMVKEFTKEIINWLEGIPEVAGFANEDHIRPKIQKLAEMLQSQHATLKKDPKANDKAAGEMRHLLNDILSEEQHVMATNDQDIHVHDLLGRLDLLIKEEKAVDFTLEVPDLDPNIDQNTLDRITEMNAYQKSAMDLKMFTMEVANWFDKFRVLSTGNRELDKQMVQKLSKRLEGLRFKINNKKNCARMEKHICDWLDEIFGMKGKPINEKMKSKIADNLIKYVERCLDKRYPRINKVDGTVHYAPIGTAKLDMGQKRRRWTMECPTQHTYDGVFQAHASTSKGIFYKPQSNYSRRSNPYMTLGYNAPTESNGKTVKNGGTGQRTSKSQPSGSRSSRPTDRCSGSVGERAYSGGSKSRDSSTSPNKRRPITPSLATSSYIIDRTDKPSILSYPVPPRTRSKDKNRDVVKPGVYYMKEMKEGRKVKKKQPSPRTSDSESEKKISIDSITKRSISAAVQAGAKKLNTAEVDEVKNEVLGILAKAGVPEKEANPIATDIISKAKTVYTDDNDVDREMEDFKEIIKKDVKEVLKQHPVPNVKDIESALTDLLTDEIVRGRLNDQARGSMFNMLTEADVTNSTANVISQKLIDRANMRSQSQYAQEENPEDSDAKIHKFLQIAEKVITKFVKDRIGDVSPDVREKMNEATLDLLDTLGDLAESTAIDSEEKTDLMMNEIAQYLREMPLTSDELEEELAQQVLEQIKESVIVTATSVSDALHNAYNESDPFEDNAMRYGNNLAELITKWLDTLPNTQEQLKDKKLKEVLVKDLVNDVLDRQKYLQLNPDRIPTDEEELETLKYQVFRLLNKKLGVNDINPHIPNIEDLLSNIKALPVTQLVKPSNKKVIDEISSWLEPVPSSLHRSNDKKYLNDTVKDLATNIIKHIGDPDSDTLIENDIRNWLPKAIDVRDVDVNKMIGSLKSYLKRKGIIDEKPEAVKSYKKAAEVLFDTVEKWCNNLPIYIGCAPDDKQKTKNIKQNLATKIMNKIGEINMDPEIFNDDYLYENTISDELDKILATIPSNQELKKYLPSLKRDLISHIKDARQKISDELAGQAYKQQLRDTIGNTVISRTTDTLTPDENFSLELLKDYVVDAFVNLHYNRSNDVDREKLKKKIADEVNKFCFDYSRHHPSAKLDEKQLNDDLFNALVKIPVPKDESMRNEIEQVRIKELINDWLNEVPTHEETVTDLIQRNKMTSLLAKKLHELEKKKEAYPCSQEDNDMFEEITKYLKKLPLRPGSEYEIPRLASKLIERMRSSEETRRFNPSCSYFGKRICTNRSIPPCGLSLEDQCHMQRVKNRNQRMPSKRQCRDAYVNPAPVDQESQTELRHYSPIGPLWQRSPCPNIRSSATQVPNDYCNSCQIPYDNSPHVLIKEYVWDTTDYSKIGSGYNLSSPCVNLPSQGTFTNMLDQNQVASMSPYQQGVNMPPCHHGSSISPCMNQGPSMPPCVSVQCRPIPQPSTSYEYRKPCQCSQHQQTQRASEDRGTCYKLPEAIIGEPLPGTSRPCRPQMTRRRSTSDSKRRRYKRPCEDDSEWSSFKFADESDFWEAYSKHDMCCEPFRERERKEEKVRCRCKERIVSRRPERCAREQSCDEALKGCSKCGINCPHPSYLFFR